VGAVPELGQHTAEILHSIGYDARAVEALAAEGVVETSSQASPPTAGSALKRCAPDERA
jgi:hypothetical protein